MTAVAIAAALGVTATAGAVDYPPPKEPKGATGKPKGPFRTLRVCKTGHSCFPRIQDAVNEARAGDTVKVDNGTWKEAVRIIGAKKRYLKLVGNNKNPNKVVLEGSGKKANGVLVNGADKVTISGFRAQHYRSNGFFVTNASDYKMTRLVAWLGGVYGIYAFNTKGGEISNSEAAWHNDAGFYIGQTPPQSRPKRSIVKNVTSYGNVIGFSGTNMKYVTIQDSKFYNNGTGIVPNALDSEKYAPPEQNVITRNEVFWNNFNYYKGSPFKKEKTKTGGVPYPVGIGILLFGGRNNQVTGNKVYGNYLVGVGALQQFLLQKYVDAKDLIGNEVQGNDFGLGGADRNGRDISYDGNGSGNCWGPNTGVQTMFPEDGSTMPACPFTGANAFNADAQKAAVDWALDATHEAAWIKYPHVAKPGITPLETYTGGVK
ncbi:MAG: right-handed parallel beta-helix repeat-containing protein [Solirubrobacterales bacterium]|nr:right-handed parallel beta-helix repeat-containing protein [Solirubrobacterales bacterium]